MEVVRRETANVKRNRRRKPKTKSKALRFSKPQGFTIIFNHLNFREAQVR
jgi:hypothetical protein